jgi:pimeloyl-ACP methyl ester carboxylesterase
VGNSLGGLAALRAAERDDLPLGGVIAVCPAGLRYGRWLMLLAAFNPLPDRILPVFARLPVPVSLVRLYAQLLYEACCPRDRPTGSWSVAMRPIGRGCRTRHGCGMTCALDRDEQAVVRPAAITQPILLIWEQCDALPRSGRPIPCSTTSPAHSLSCCRTAATARRSSSPTGSPN